MTAAERDRPVMATEHQPWHRPRRPEWDCAHCGERWPCALAKAQLAEEYRHDPTSLSAYLHGQMWDAIDDARRTGAGGNPAGLFDRMVGWAPGRCMRDGPDGEAATAL